MNCYKTLVIHQCLSFVTELSENVDELYLCPSFSTLFVKTLTFLRKGDLLLFLLAPIKFFLGERALCSPCDSHFPDT